jgi:hypothetical protein
VLARKLIASHANCEPLAGKSMLNRLKLSKIEPTRYNKSAADTAAIYRLSVRLFFDAKGKVPPNN